MDRLGAADRSDFRIRKLRRKLSKFGEAVDWSCSLEDVVNYLNDRREEVSNRTLFDDTQVIKQFLDD
ncbi:hypothetical protein AKJ52_02395, partial [candidate division MSBL1 archaeon SCGC-AAA382C18]